MEYEHGKNPYMLKGCFILDAHRDETFEIRLTEARWSPDYDNDPIKAWFTRTPEEKARLEAMGAYDLLRCHIWGISPGARKAIEEVCGPIQEPNEDLEGVVVKVRRAKKRTKDPQTGQMVHDIQVVNVQPVPKMVAVTLRASERKWKP